MAQSNLYLLTSVDVRRASRPGTSRANIITSLTMPGLVFATAEHNPGGGVIAANFAMPRIEAPEPAFTVKGIDTEAFVGMGETDTFTFAGSYKMRGPGQGRVVPARAVIEGAITSWEPDESDPAEFAGCTHTLAEVTHYELVVDGKELFYVDMWERVLRVDGRDLMAPHRTALGA
jgi:P2 family phage contractile tail tube protein